MLILTVLSILDVYHALSLGELEYGFHNAKSFYM